MALLVMKMESKSPGVYGVGYVIDYVATDYVVALWNRCFSSLTLRKLCPFTNPHPNPNPSLKSKFLIYPPQPPNQL